MRMRPMIIDAGVKEELAALVKHAEENVQTIDDLLDTMNKQKLPVGDDPDFCLALFGGYRIVYSIEEHPKGRMRHLSVSVDEDNMMPGVPAVAMIMQLIGFTHTLEECLANSWVTTEVISPVRQAINVHEPIN